MNNEDEIIEDLILKGALEVSGIDLDTGEPIYNFTKKMKEISPELYRESFTYFYTEVLKLWENGFVNMNILEENPIVSVTPKAFNKEEVKKLTKDEVFSLNEIIRITEEQPDIMD
jgi:hypothetical protein